MGESERGALGRVALVNLQASDKSHVGREEEINKYMNEWAGRGGRGGAKPIRQPGKSRGIITPSSSVKDELLNWADRVSGRGGSIQRRVGPAATQPTSQQSAEWEGKALVGGGARAVSG